VADKNMWWGYVHTNGSLQPKLYLNDPLDLQEARESPFCGRVFEPFEADNREAALKYMREHS